MHLFAFSYRAISKHYKTFTSVRYTVSTNINCVNIQFVSGSFISFNQTRNNNKEHVEVDDDATIRIHLFCRLNFFFSVTTFKICTYSAYIVGFIINNFCIMFMPYKTLDIVNM